MLCYSWSFEHPLLEGLLVSLVLFLSLPLESACRLCKLNSGFYWLQIWLPFVFLSISLPCRFLRGLSILMGRRSQMECDSQKKKKKTGGDGRVRGLTKRTRIVIGPTSWWHEVYLESNKTIIANCVQTVSDILWDRWTRGRCRFGREVRRFVSRRQTDCVEGKTGANNSFEVQIIQLARLQAELNKKNITIKDLVTEKMATHCKQPRIDHARNPY